MELHDALLEATALAITMHHRTGDRELHDAAMMLRVLADRHKPVSLYHWLGAEGEV